MLLSNPPDLDLIKIKVLYAWAEEKYLKLRPLKNIIESTPHATQRKITLESFDSIRVSRPDVQCFNELLVQYPRLGEDPEKPGQVVPDNMVVIHSEPIKAVGSFNTPLEPVGPLLVLDYFSKKYQRKDYEDNFLMCEREIQVPYYLHYNLDTHEPTLFYLNEGKYLTIGPNANGRYAIPELELEAALHEGWVRYWFRGELLPLPGDLLQQLNATKNQLNATKNQLDATQHRLVATQGELTSTKSVLDSERQARASLEAEVAKLREELARAKPQS